MAESSGDKRPIIIKKIKKGGHGHHGGAWKVAYADFVTAMMAFFLLMWLLGATNEQQRKGIAEYFDPIAVSKSTSGSGGVLGGKSPSPDDAAKISDSMPKAVKSMDPGVAGQEQSAPKGQEFELENKANSLPQDPSDTAPPGSEDGSGTPDQSAGADPNAADKAKPDLAKSKDQELEKELAKREVQQFEEAKKDIIQAIQSDPELKGLDKHLIVDETPEGLRIQIIDQDGEPMFASGGSLMSPKMRQILTLVTKVVKNMPNKISIRGHTDAVQFKGMGKDNWDLSSERANASRRAISELGLPASRIATVVGRADQEPLLPEKPNDAQNRRISLILLRAHRG